jgi:hypothetical protein
MDAAMKLWERFIQQTDAFGSWDGMRASRAATEENRAFTYKLLTDSLSLSGMARCRDSSSQFWSMASQAGGFCGSPFVARLSCGGYCLRPALFTFHSVF